MGKAAVAAQVVPWVPGVDFFSTPGSSSLGSLPGVGRCLCSYTWTTETPFAASRPVRLRDQQRPSVHWFSAAQGDTYDSGESQAPTPAHPPSTAGSVPACTSQ